jgi:hypothetical protein
MPQGRAVTACRDAECTRSSGHIQGFTWEGEHIESHQKPPFSGGFFVELGEGVLEALHARL